MDLTENDIKKVDEMKQTLEHLRGDLQEKITRIDTKNEKLIENLRGNLQEKIRHIDIKKEKLIKMSRAKKDERYIVICMPPENNERYTSIFGKLYTNESSQIGKFREERRPFFTNKVKITAFYQSDTRIPIGIITENKKVFFFLDQTLEQRNLNMWLSLFDEWRGKICFLEMSSSQMVLRWTDDDTTFIFFEEL
jgi:hypothetical protein